MSDSYQVFARKYRPRTFAEVLGQDHVVRTLENAIAKNRLAHAYLFVGPRGTGKTTTARILSKALNCPDGPKVDFDPDDPICVEIAEGRNLDVLEIDGASNNGVDQVRELRETVNYAPANCPFKIYYIDEVHMLTNQAFNALLKTLEEPPPHVKFIFATTEPGKILPTIISRCQRFDLRPIPAETIASHLLHIAKEEAIVLDDLAAHAIARGADGGMRDAQSMLDQLVAFCGEKITEQDVLSVFGFTSTEVVAGLVEDILSSRAAEALRTVRELAETGKELGGLLSDIVTWLRDLVIHQVDPAATPSALPEAVKGLLAKQSAMAKRERLLNAIDVFAEADARMSWSTNSRLHLEVAVIKAIEAVESVGISDVINVLGGSSDALAAMGVAGSGGSSEGGGSPAPESTSDSSAAPAASSAGDDKGAEEPSAEVEAPASSEATAAVETPTSASATAAAPEATAPATPVEAAPAVAAPDTSAEAATSVVGLAAVAGEAAPAPVSSEEPPAAPDAPEEPVSPEASVAEAPAGSVSDSDLWAEVARAVEDERPLASAWAERGTYSTVEGDLLKVSFPDGEDAAIENLKRKEMLQFLEGAATRLAGRAIVIEMGIDASLDPVPEPPKLEEVRPEPSPEAAVPDDGEGSPSPRPELPGAPADASGDAFYKDPLIEEALRIFKGEIEGGAAPA